MYPTQDYMIPEEDFPVQSYGTESPEPKPAMVIQSSGSREKMFSYPDNQLGLSPSPQPTEIDP